MVFINFDSLRKNRSQLFSFIAFHFVSFSSLLIGFFVNFDSLGKYIFDWLRTHKSLYVREERELRADFAKEKTDREARHKRAQEENQAKQKRFDNQEKEWRAEIYVQHPGPETTQDCVYAHRCW